jgi:hypothetical protein
MIERIDVRLCNSLTSRFFAVARAAASGTLMPAAWAKINSTSPLGLPFPAILCHPFRTETLSENRPRRAGVTPAWRFSDKAGTLWQSHFPVGVAWNGNLNRRKLRERRISLRFLRDLLFVPSAVTIAEAAEAGTGNATRRIRLRLFQETPRRALSARRGLGRARSDGTFRYPSVWMRERLRPQCNCPSSSERFHLDPQA